MEIGKMCEKKREKRMFRKTQQDLEPQCTWTKTPEETELSPRIRNTQAEDMHLEQKVMPQAKERAEWTFKK